MDGFAVACGEAAEVFELVEAAFDTIALLLEFTIIGPLLLAIAFWRDHRVGAPLLRLCDQNIGVVTAVGDDGFSLSAFQRLRGRRILAGLPCGEAELQRQAMLIDQQVNFGAQPSSGTPQSRVFEAPFLRPVAAC